MEWSLNREANVFEFTHSSSLLSIKYMSNKTIRLQVVFELYSKQTESNI